MEMERKERERERERERNGKSRRKNWLVVWFVWFGEKEDENEESQTVAGDGEMLAAVVFCLRCNWTQLQYRSRQSGLHFARRMIGGWRQCYTC